MIIAGVVLFLTAAFGWTAAATKDDCLSFCVSYISSQTILTQIHSIVWLPRYVHHARLYLDGRLNPDCEIFTGAINERRMRVKERYGLWIGSDLHTRRWSSLLRSLPMQCRQRHLLRWGLCQYGGRHHGPDKTWGVPIRCKRDEWHIEDEILPHLGDPWDWLLMLWVLFWSTFLSLLGCQEWTANRRNLQVENYQCNWQARKPLRRSLNLHWLRWIDRL